MINIKGRQRYNEKYVHCISGFYQIKSRFTVIILKGVGKIIQNFGLRKNYIIIWIIMICARKILNIRQRDFVF